MIRQGAFADLVVFSPDTIADQATYENPHAPCLGIQQVVVNGHLIYDGEPLPTAKSELPGRYLKRQGV